MFRRPISARDIEAYHRSAFIRFGERGASAPWFFPVEKKPPQNLASTINLAPSLPTTR